jgi:chorismate mutase/prephenate dehydratase
MGKYNFHISKGIKLKINHSLLAVHGTDISDIKEIISHEQGIGQCGNFLSALGDIKITICENTAVAAKIAAESGRNDIAAISSAECARNYGLSILKRDIQDSDNNYTRFICISKEPEIYPDADKISLMLTLPHTPGSLASALAYFSSLGINLTKLESRPISTRDFEFVFYINISASVRSEDTLKALAGLERTAESLTFLGNYKEI